MENRVKNIIVLSLVFTAMSVSLLWFTGSDKPENLRPVARPANPPLETAQPSPHPSSPQTELKMERSAEVIIETPSGDTSLIPDVGGSAIRQIDAAEHMALGVEYYKNNDLPKAMWHLQEVLRIEPDNNNARNLISKISREARVEERFVNKEGSHFNVKYEGGESDVAGHMVAIILEEAYGKIGSDLGFHPSDSITAILYSTEQFRDVTRAPAWSGAIYDGKIRIPVGGVRERSDVLEKVIFHEYTHAVVHRMGGGMVPTWLNEGIAQFEEGRMGEREDMFRYLAAAEKLVPLNYLEGSFMGLTQEQAMIAYAEGLSAVKYIIDEYGMGILTRLMSAYKDGKGSEAAIKDTFQMTYKEFQESWIRSLRKRYN